jgi:oligoribonuclease NrnB/cAMP/cGMP phosphodiesterase (DHH superfamily)
MIIFHHNDADGRCSAAIAKWWFDLEVMNGNKQALVESKTSPVRFVEMDYKNRVPVELVKPEDTVVIVDFSFKPEDMAAIQAATNIGVIWCDHHITAKDYGYEVPGYRDFNNKGLAGCECTWKFFFPNANIPNWIRTLGDYDAWRMQEKDLCLPFYEGLKLEDQSQGDNSIWYQLLTELTDVTFYYVMDRGRAAIRYRDNYCTELCKSYGYETSIGGYPAYALNVSRFGSQAFGDKFTEYPICIAYIYDGRVFTVSLYSETIDVSTIAKIYGGGGHKGASGFNCKQLPFEPNKS